MGRFWKAILFVLLISSQGAFVSAQEQVLVAGGEFKLPAILNKKPLKVRAFYLDRHPVTNKDYLSFIKGFPQWGKSQVKSIFADKEYLEYWPTDTSYGGAKFENSPVVRVSWYAARAYCESKGQRLPTVNEWEYVGLGSYKSQDSVQAKILEWYGQTAEWPLASVMKKEPNSFGLHDLHGLVWEWVEDFNSSMVTGESRADGSLDKNLFCGAGASGAADPADYAAFMRYAFRSSLQAKYTVQNLGFRCAKDKD